MLVIGISRCKRIQLGYGRGCLIGDIVQNTEESHISEFLLEFCQSALGYQLHQDSVVTFKGCIYLRVIFQPVNPVFGKISFAAAALPALL